MLVASMSINRQKQSVSKMSWVFKEADDGDILPPPPKRKNFIELQRAPFSHITGPLKMEQIGCCKMAVQNYQSMLCNISEERRSHMLAMKALVWLRMVWFRVGALYANLR